MSLGPAETTAVKQRRANISLLYLSSSLYLALYREFARARLRLYSFVRGMRVGKRPPHDSSGPRVHTRTGLGPRIACTCVGVVGACA